MCPKRYLSHSPKYTDFCSYILENKKTCFKFKAKRVLVQRVPNWQILA